jgi:hypothetical protein
MRAGGVVAEVESPVRRREADLPSTFVYRQISAVSSHRRGGVYLSDLCCRRRANGDRGRSVAALKPADGAEGGRPGAPD